MNKELIYKITKYANVSYDFLDDYWVIITNEGIFAPNQGATFHESYAQAWKHWYREHRWRAVRQYQMDYALKHNGSTSDYWRVATDKTEREIWETFKSTMIQEHGFKIVQWKDAKGDVCGQSRA